jgi:orotate phosphoribosyltransferase
MIASDLANLIAKEFPEATIVGGVATAGIPHAALVAEKLHLPMVYGRPKPKDHGKGRQIEGRFSVLNAVKATEKDGGHVAGVSSIFTYYLPDAKENFKKANVKYAPLLSYPELLKKENESGHITSEQYDILKTWHEDPWAWGKKFNN